MPAVWTAPEAFGPAMLGAPFVAMQPEPTAGLRYSLFDLAEPLGLLNTAMAAIDGGRTPVAALADFILELGDRMSLITGPLPTGPGTETKAVGPIFTPEAFDDSANSRASQQAALAAVLAPADATKVALGCIDTSIAFVNARFRKVAPEGGPDRTRFEMLWIQGRALKTPGPFSAILRAGTLLLRQDIDALIAKHWSKGRLDEAAVYAEFTAPPAGHADLWSMRGGHGTTVLDLMAGAPHEAPDETAALYGVELPVTVVSDTSGAVFHGPLTYGLGLIGIASYALSRTAGGQAAPLVANASLGFLGGPHDGSHPTAAALNAITEAAKGPSASPRPVDLTLPAGNHLQDRIHARTLPLNSTPLHWSLPPEDRTASFVEIWSETPGQPPDVTTLTLTPPGETGGIATLLPGSGELVHLEVGGKRLARAYNLGTHFVVGVFATSNWTPGAAEAPSGLWSLTVTGAGHTPNLLWVARDDTLTGLKSAGRQSWLRDPAYMARNGYGDYLVGSALAAEGLRRDGTLSVIATTGAPVTTVSGRERFGTQPYRLAGLEIGSATPPAPGPFAPAAEVSRTLGGPMAATRLGFGATRLSGTSMASAIQARHIADGYLGTTSNPLGYREPTRYRF